MSYENYASICSSKKIQNEQHVHRHQSSITKKENAQREAGRREQKRNRSGKYIYTPYHWKEGETTQKKTIAAAQILMLHYRGASLTMLTLNSQFRWEAYIHPESLPLKWPLQDPFLLKGRGTLAHGTDRFFFSLDFVFLIFRYQAGFHWLCTFQEEKKMNFWL